MQASVEYKYAIYELPGQGAYGGDAILRYVADSLEEAEAHVMEFADWGSPKGTCHMRKVDKRMNVYGWRWYDEGEAVEGKSDF